MMKKIVFCTIFCMVLYCISAEGGLPQRTAPQGYTGCGYSQEGTSPSGWLYLQAPAEDPPHVDEDKRQPVEAPAEDPGEGIQETFYAVLCIENDTTVDITYWYKWGEGAWESFVLKSKEQKLHSQPWKEKEDAQTSPDFFVKFYTDISGKSHVKESKLGAYLAPEDSCTYGNVYHFKIKEQRIYLAEN